MNVPSGTFHANVQDLVKRLENGELHAYKQTINADPDSAEGGVP
jgi:hypothetical protein